MAFQELDGPSKQIKLSVTTTTVVELKADTSNLDERKVITLQPLGGNLYLYYGDGVNVPSTSTVQNNGFVLVASGLYTVEGSPRQIIYILAVTATIGVVVAERA